MKLSGSGVLFLVLMVVIGVVMTSGCNIGTKTGDAEYEDQMAENGLKMCETTNAYEPYNFTTNQWITKEQKTQTQQNSQETEKDTQTTQKSTQTTQTTKTSTTTTTKPASCSHPSITTKYVGLDKSTGKVIYDTYCSKCGEYMGRTLY